MSDSINNMLMKAGKIWYNAKEVLKFYFKADTVHGVDSPFLFSLLMNTVEVRNKNEAIYKIERFKKKLFSLKDKFSRFDLGKGSMTMKQNQVILGKWAKLSSIDDYNGKLLFHLSSHLKPDKILELGTAAGISALYLATGNPDSRVFTLEADPYLCKLAKQHADDFGLHNIFIKEGDFADTLAPVLNEMHNTDLVFIDGQHHSQALARQIRSVYPYLSKNKVVIIDDIRWSEDMYSAWLNLVKDDRWNISLDLYRMGLLIYNDDIKHRLFKKIMPSRWKRWKLGMFR